MVIKKCQRCGKEFTPRYNMAHRQIYCSKECRLEAEREQRTGSSRGIPGARRTDYPIPYNPNQAQAAHNRQADIERRARAAGLSYGKYMARKYMDSLKEAEA